jgi:hypothetical protein
MYDVAPRSALAILSATSLWLIGSAQSQTFSAPCGGTAAYEGTVAVSINPAGTVTGFCIAAGTVYHGFIRTANGTITAPIDIAGAGTRKNEGTYPYSINTAGTIAGAYSTTGSGTYGVYHGFTRSSGGTVATFDAPNAYAGGNLGTAAASINPAGTVTGMYRDTSLVYHGFVRTSKGVITAPIDVPGAGTGNSQGTRPISINPAGIIAGSYVDASNASHGFLLASPYTAQPTTFDVPGAGTGSGQGTKPLTINTVGTITGLYTDASNINHGFQRSKTGAITTFDAPAAGADVWLASLMPKGFSVEGTGAFSLNAAGEVVGTYTDAGNVQHGFVRATNSSITSFSVPGAAGGVIIGGTGGFGINPAGVVAGTYTDKDSVAHGFVLTPSATTLSSTPNPSSFEQPVTFTAKVTSTAGTPSKGETISFMAGSTVLGTGTLNNGSASFVTSALPVGATSVTAVYANDSQFLGSTSKADKQVVKKAD